MIELSSELFKREYSDCLADVKSEGANIENVWCAGAWYSPDYHRQCFIVESFIYKMYLCNWI